MTRFDAVDLKRAIRHRHSGRGAVLIEELRTACGFVGGAERYMDVWAIEANASKGCTAQAYEIKASRADFLRDVKQPLKQRGARLFSDQFWFVTPPDLLKAEEIPDWAGLLEPYPQSNGLFESWEQWPILRQVVPAPFRSKDAPSWPLVVSMLRRTPIILPEEPAALAAE